MLKIKLEYLSWLSESLEIGGSGSPLLQEQEVKEGSNVKDLFHDLAASNPRFAQVVFDIDLEKINEKVSILYNNHPLELENGLKTRLKDGDVLILIPIIQGG
jgi:molybdopterin converting factor small subunit